MKRCNACKLLLPVEAFHRNKACADGRHTKCAGCVRAQKKRFRDANGELIRARRAARRDRARAEYQKWVARNPTYFAEYYAANKQRKDANTVRWAKDNAHRHRMYQANRRAALAGADAKGAATDYAAIIQADPCVYCGSPATEIDHIVPIARGGTGAWDNLAPICSTCNRQKYTRSVLHMLMRRLSA